ncbi:hypothetical protein CL616_00235 [archaeon]|nr:hypothetical protein [archaeon]|tara:strand:+ start:17 stop:436 length:420 start_codon:yes stop_codon:yes gene_type:complete
MRLMDWSLCDRNFIKRVEVDKERVSSIVKMALKRLERARSTKVTKDNVSFVVEDYYEVIKELLVAFMLKNGFRSKNHQCLISYFYKEKKLEREAILIAQMSFYRNRLNYYGDSIPLVFHEENKKEFEEIIKILKGIIKE